MEQISLLLGVEAKCIMVTMGIGSQKAVRRLSGHLSGLNGLVSCDGKFDAPFIRKFGLR